MKKLILVLCLCHPPAFCELVDKTIAKVGKELILLSDVNDLLSSHPSGAMTLEKAREQLINNATLVSECKKYDIYPTESEIKEQINAIKKQNRITDDYTLRLELLKAGMSLESYEEKLYFEKCQTNIVQSKIRNRVNISQQDVERILSQRTGRTPEERLRTKCVSVTPASKEEQTRALAVTQDLLQRLKQGESFEEVSQTSFEGITVSLVNFEPFTRSEMVSEFAGPLFMDSPQKLRGPIEYGGKFYIFEILERLEDDRKPLVNQEKELHKQLFEAEVERLLKQYNAEARASTYVEVF